MPRRPGSGYLPRHGRSEVAAAAAGLCVRARVPRSCLLERPAFCCVPAPTIQSDAAMYPPGPAGWLGMIGLAIPLRLSAFVARHRAFTARDSWQSAHFPMHMKNTGL